MNYVASGRSFTTKVVTSVVSPGATISFPVNVKSFIIKVFGGTTYFKAKSTDSDADAFRLDDGDTIQIDLQLPYPIATNTSTCGIVFTSSGTVQVYVLAAY